MDTSWLENEILKRGMDCHIEPFTYLSRLTHAHDCVHCVKAKKRSLVAGFRVHVGSNMSFISLYSGHTYIVEPAEQILEIAESIYKELLSKKWYVPRRIPENVMASYNISLCDILHAYPQSDADTLKLAEQVQHESIFDINSSLGMLRSHGCRCEARPDNVVKVEYLNSKLLTRFDLSGNQPCGALPLLVYGNWPGNPATNELLQVVSKALSCDLFDCEWKNRIHWDDPYYLEQGDNIPEAPLNRPEDWWEDDDNDQ